MRRSFYEKVKKETILNCLKENLKNLEKLLDISGNKRIIDNVRNI